MKTFAIRNGDLVVASGGYALIDGPRKVGQDLRMAVGEPLGNDRFHPGWGSALDSMIGGIADPDTAFRARQEVARVINNYMAVQRDMMASDIATGRRSRFSTGEVVSTVDSISATPNYDAVNIRVALRTADASTVLVDTTAGGTT